MSTTTIVAVYADLFESSHNIKKRDRRRPELKTLVEMPHFATHHTTEEHVKKKKKKSTDPKEATSPECKCRRAPSSSHYLQCRRILNSLRISRETDPTERKTLRNRHRIKHGTEFRSSRRTIGKNQIQRAEIGCRS